MRLVILGGSYLQADFVNRALEKEHKVFVLDMNPNCFLGNHPGCTFVNINFFEESLVLDFCIKRNIDFVYAPVSEMGNIISARLAPKLGYKYNDIEVVMSTIDKSIQRKILSQNSAKVQSPKSVIFGGELNKILDDIRFPMVVKISNSSGGRGIIGVSNLKELELALLKAKNINQSNGKVLVEQFIEGTQLSVETLTVDSKHYIIGITKEVVMAAPSFIERSHFMSKKIHDKYYPVLLNPIKELLNIFNLKWGPCHIEIKIDNGNVWLVEIASRSGGLRDRLMFNAGYPDYNALILNCYLNHNFKIPNLNAPKRNALVNILTYSSDLKSVEKGEKDKVLESKFFNGKSSNANPKNIIDAYGYAHFKSENDLTKYSLR